MELNQAVSALRKWAIEIDHPSLVSEGIVRPLTVTLDAKGKGFSAVMCLYVVSAPVPLYPGTLSASNYTMNYLFSGYVDIRLPHYGAIRSDTLGTLGSRFNSIPDLLDHLYGEFARWYTDKFTGSK